MLSGFDIEDLKADARSKDNFRSELSGKTFQFFKMIDGAKYVVDTEKQRRDFEKFNQSIVNHIFLLQISDAIARNEPDQDQKEVDKNSANVEEKKQKPKRQHVVLAVRRDFSAFLVTALLVLQVCFEVNKTGKISVSMFLAIFCSLIAFIFK